MLSPIGSGKQYTVYGIWMHALFVRSINYVYICKPDYNYDTHEHLALTKKAQSVMAATV